MHLLNKCSAAYVRPSPNAVGHVSNIAFMLLIQIKIVKIKDCYDYLLDRQTGSWCAACAATSLCTQNPMISYLFSYLDLASLRSAITTRAYASCLWSSSRCFLVLSFPLRYTSGYYQSSRCYKQNPLIIQCTSGFS